MPPRSLIGDLLKLCDWQVGKEHLGMLGWFLTDVFGDVAKCKVDWVCLLVLKHCKLGLVRRNDNWDIVTLQSFVSLSTSL
jgi:hypothetical protein